MRTIWEIGSLMISNIVHPGIVLCYSGVWMNLTIFEVKYPICARPPQPPKRGNDGMKQNNYTGVDPKHSGLDHRGTHKASHRDSQWDRHRNGHRKW